MFSKLFKKVSLGFGKAQKCQHINKTEVWRDYQDAYIKFRCDSCGEAIYESLYPADGL